MGKPLQGLPSVVLNLPPLRFGQHPKRRRPWPSRATMNEEELRTRFATEFVRIMTDVCPPLCAVRDPSPGVQGPDLQMHRPMHQEAWDQA